MQWFSGLLSLLNWKSGTLAIQEDVPFSPASLRDNWRLGDGVEDNVEKLSVNFWSLTESSYLLLEITSIVKNYTIERKKLMFTMAMDRGKVIGFWLLWKSHWLALIIKKRTQWYLTSCVRLGISKIKSLFLVQHPHLFTVRSESFNFPLFSTYCTDLIKAVNSHTYQCGKNWQPSFIYSAASQAGVAAAAAIGDKDDHYLGTVNGHGGEFITPVFESFGV